MNKVIAVNLNGNAYQLEEIGYDRLRAYLDSAAAGLAGNPDRDEILADIEQAIAEKFRAALGPHKTVVATRDVERVIAEMGPVAGGATAESAAGAAGPAAGSAAPGAGFTPGAAPGTNEAPRRLYLIHEGAMIGGVCNGIAVYFGIDVSIVRVVFALAALLYGSGILAYLLLMFIVPSATTPEQKAAAQGLPKTAQEFIHRAKAGYYQGMKTWGDRRARREWRRKFKAEMRGLGQQIKQDVHNATWNCRQNWGQWPASPAFPGAWVVLKALEILFVILLLLVLFHHGFWGWWTWHFGGMPWWLAIVILVLVFELIRLPFKAAAFWGPGYGRWHSPLESLLSLLFFAFLIWLLNRHVPAFHQFLSQIPDFLRYMADSIHTWWVRNVH
ncbi:MAG TPA: PspC domain-containing protein [Opitutaceae bacterium]|jgi:phage shock protein PspC (stress-responsive transcriptional regulator)|nr:PspC domain-containing protein [Opitutaceae bacterium]